MIKHTKFVFLLAFATFITTACRGHHSDSKETSYNEAIESSENRGMSSKNHHLSEELTETNGSSKQDKKEITLNGDWTTTVGLPKFTTNVSSETITHTGYVVSYNPDNRIPNWVMWHLTSDRTDGPYKRDGRKFLPDPDVSNSPTTNEYVNSGYDRGHMCPSADNRWSDAAQTECFYMSNICPQKHNLNAGDWNEMEMQCRKWAERYGDIYIVCGPILYKGVHKKVSKSIVVPEAFFKVVYCPSRKKAIGFIYKNTEGNRPKGDYVNTVDQVERITGLDFFPALPKALQDSMEAEANLSDWL